MLIGVFLDTNKKEDMEMIEQLMHQAGEMVKVQEIIEKSGGKVNINEIMEEIRKEPEKNPELMEALMKNSEEV